jgi:hypothetical protein
LTPPAERQKIEAMVAIEEKQSALARLNAGVTGCHD